MGHYRDDEESLIQFYPPGERPPLTAVQKQIRQYEIDELLTDPEEKERAEAALDLGNDDEVFRILFGRNRSEGKAE